MQSARPFSVRKGVGNVKAAGSVRWRKRLYGLVFTLLAVLGYGSYQAAVSLVPPPWAPPDARPYRVVRVIDGDTIEVRRYPFGQPDRVRYLGLDAPEVSRGGRGSPEQQGETFGDEATEANRRLVEGRKVWLAGDEQERDGHGRLLGYVFADGLFVNRELVAGGYAQVMLVQPNLRFAEEMVTAQKEAREAGRGIWSRVVEPESPQRLADYVGEWVRLRGEVQSVVVGDERRPDVIQLQPAGVAVLRFPEFRQYFPATNFQDLKGRTVDVMGLLEMRDGRFQIVIREAGQLEILGFTT